MAQRTEIRLIDDLDGSEASETVSFGIDGTAYEVDLSAAHAAELRQALASYVAVARKTGGAARRASRSSRPGGPNPTDVRAWAT